MLDKVEQSRLGPKEVKFSFHIVGIRKCGSQVLDAYTESPQLVDAGSRVEQSSRKPRMDSEVGWASQVTP